VCAFERERAKENDNESVNRKRNTKESDGKTQLKSRRTQKIKEVETTRRGKGRIATKGTSKQGLTESWPWKSCRYV